MMWRYTLRRLLYFLPTLWLISLIAFFLSRSTPGDPARKYCIDPMQYEGSTLLSYQQALQSYKTCAAAMGFHKPLFYFSVQAAIYPDTLHHVTDYYRRAWLTSLLRQYGSWSEVQAYVQSIDKLPNALLQQSSSNQADWRTPWFALQRTHDPMTIQVQLERLRPLLEPSQMSVVDDRFRDMQNSQNRDRWIPSFRWHGLDNQYHHWISGWIQGRWGVSYVDKKPVLKKIWQALRWTLLINGVAIFLAFAMAIPIGLQSGFRAGSRMDYWSHFWLLVLYSLPVFWVATLLVIFFTTPEYGLDWFPSGGLGYVAADVGFWEWLLIRIRHLCLPIFCMTYGALALIARQMRASTIKIMQQPFIAAAQSKGIATQKLLRHHVLPNALFPIVTLLGGILPALIAGSIVVEVIFGIPGMGQLTFQSILIEDWSVVFAILLLSALLTVLGILLADLLYAFLDPRIRL